MKRNDDSNYPTGSPSVKPDRDPAAGAAKLPSSNEPNTENFFPRLSTLGVEQLKNFCPGLLHRGEEARERSPPTYESLKSWVFLILSFGMKNEKQRILPLKTPIQSGAQGYTQVPHAILMAMSRAKLRSACHQMLWACLRFRHGFHVPDEPFSLDTARRDWLRKPDGSRWSRQETHRAAKELADRRIFVIGPDDKKRVKYGIQNDTRKWKLRSHVMERKTSSKLTTKTSSGLTTKMSSESMTSSLYKKEIEKEKEKINNPPDPQRAEKNLIFKKLALARSGVSDDELLKWVNEKPLEELEAIYASLGGR